MWIIRLYIMKNMYPFKSCASSFFKLLQLYIREKEYTEECKNLLVSMRVNGKDIVLCYLAFQGGIIYSWQSAEMYYAFIWCLPDKKIFSTRF